MTFVAVEKLAANLAVVFWGGRGQLAGTLA